MAELLVPLHCLLTIESKISHKDDHLTYKLDNGLEEISNSDINPQRRVFSLQYIPVDFSDRAIIMTFLIDKLSGKVFLLENSQRVTINPESLRESIQKSGKFLITFVATETFNL